MSQNEACPKWGLATWGSKEFHYFLFTPSVTTRSDFLESAYQENRFNRIFQREAAWREAGNSSDPSSGQSPSSAIVSSQGCLPLMHTAVEKWVSRSVSANPCERPEAIRGYTWIHYGMLKHYPFVFIHIRFSCMQISMEKRSHLSLKYKLYARRNNALKNFTQCNKLKQMKIINTQTNMIHEAIKFESRIKSQRLIVSE